MKYQSVIAFGTASFIEAPEQKGHEVSYHDLYRENFDPLLPSGEILKDESVRSRTIPSAEKASRCS